MPSAQTSLAALLLLLALVIDEAQCLFEKQKFQLEAFDYETSYRTDLCAISQKYAPRQLNYAPRQHNPSPPKRGVVLGFSAEGLC